MENKNQSYLRMASLALIAFIIGVTIADDIKKTFRSPLLRFGNSQAIDQYLKTHSVRKLQLVAGSNNPQGWLNSDLEPSDNQVYIDATTTFPLPDQSFQYVFNEHLIEHLPWEPGIVMLRESYRTLANGGEIRIVTPNLTKFVQLLGAAPDAEAQRFIDAKFRIGGVPINAVPATYILNRQMREWDINLSTIRQAFGRVSSWLGLSRSPNTKLPRRPTRYSRGGILYAPFQPRSHDHKQLGSDGI